MRLLLDTHVLIWWHEGNPRLQQRTRALIGGAEKVYVSMVSAWEAAIKISQRKLQLRTDVSTQIDLNGFETLWVNFDHIKKIESMPFYHHDPFDRMMVAQCLVDDLTMVTDDKLIMRYGVKNVVP